MYKKIFIISLVTSLNFTFANENIELCIDVESQSMRNECIDQEYKKIDDDLNTQYKDYRTLLGSREKDNLKTGQIAWLKYKEVDCELYSDRYKNGYLYHYVLTNCHIEKTRIRINELSTLIELKKEDQ